MSTTTKDGSCRIPTLRSRLPPISSAKSQPVLLQSPSPEPELSKKHIGKKVRVGEKEGVLKYVGSVHFANGAWCGIELTNAVGKNDGFINGVRYFACSKLRGLMAPLAKVILIEGSWESLHEDNDSGPCLDQKLPDSPTFTNKINVNQCDNPNNCTYDLGKDNQNYQKDGGDNNLRQHCTYDLEVKRRRTSNRKCYKPLDKPSSLPELRASHHLNGNNGSNNSLINLQTLNHSTPVKTEIFEDLGKLKFSPINLPVEKDDDSNKRDSLDCEESLGILTPDQMADFTQTRSPSLEYNPLLGNNKIVTEEKLLSPSVEVSKGSFLGLGGLSVDTSKVKDSKEEVQSPNLTSASEGVNLNNATTIPRNNEQRKPTARPVVNQNNKSRRVRSRTTHNPSPLKKLVGSNIESSIHSSLSDLSASTAPPKKTPEPNKPTVKGGRTSPSVRPPAPLTPRAPIKRAPPAPRAAEALAVLVQHLVFNVEAYQVPYLRRQVEKFRLEAEESRLAYQHLEETLADEKIKQSAAIEEEHVRCRNDITELIEKQEKPNL